MANTKNRYYIWVQPYNTPIYWDISLASPIPEIEYSYFSKVLQELEERIPYQGFIFYITHDNVQELPSYGNNVIAVIVGDESCRTPRYRHQVLAVFKCYGIKPTSLVQWSMAKPSLIISSAIKFIFDRIRWIQFELASQIKQLNPLKPSTDTHQDNVFVIPLGYNKQIELPIKKIHERKYDTSFMGSISHRNNKHFSIRSSVKNPKEISRNLMIRSLIKLKEENKFKIFISSFSSFTDPNKSSSDEYSKILMESKICLAPQGTSLETFRFFEGIRYGCIVIAEVLPGHWFYKDSPAITIDSWHELEDLMSKLVTDSDFLHKKHKESLAWWNSHCSEIALAEYMYQNLESLIK
jgi:hypothetical protein